MDIEPITSSLSGQLLDTFFSMEYENTTTYELKEILEALELNPSMRAFETLARDLSILAGKNPPWTKKYIHSVYRGRVEASPMLARAISTLAQRIDGAPIGVAGAVFVKVLAQPGIPEGVLIPRNAKAVKCARPECPVRFIKTHPRQKYHDVSCRTKKDDET